MVSETHGMSQRGGSVMSHLKIGGNEAALIGRGTADAVLALEPDEALRNLPFLRLGGTVLVNGDDLFGGNVLADLIVSEEPITMVVSRTDEYDADDMKVITRDDVVIDVGKDIPRAEANGESIGMILFQGVGLVQMQEQLERLVRSESDLGLFYLEALRRMMRAGHRIAYVECDDGDWAEVDFHPDLDEMRSQVLSRLSW